jgi:hypothetical protein
MPEYALPFLQNYTFDAEERERRLDLLNGFRPGYVSEELLDAIFYIDEETTREEEEQIEGWRRRGYYPWYQWMMKWGYPPGWIAGRGEPACSSCLALLMCRPTQGSQTTIGGYAPRKGG